MNRGTTPKHHFTLPFDTGLLKTVRIVYSQMDEVILVKTGDDLIFEGDTVTTQLSQEETLRFSCRKPVEIQVRVLTKAGEAHNSVIIKTSVSRCLETEVIE